MALAPLVALFVLLLFLSRGQAAATTHVYVPVSARHADLGAPAATWASVSTPTAVPATSTPAHVGPTATGTPAAAPTSTTVAPSATATAAPPASASPTASATPTRSPTSSPTPSRTATATVTTTRTQTPSASPTATVTPMSSPTPSATPSATATTASTSTPTASPTVTPTSSPSPTSSPTPTASPTPTSAATNTPTPTPVVYGATDSFDRPDSATSLGRADSTQAWQTDGGTWGICGDRACPYPSPDTPGNYVRLQTNLTDVRAAVTIVRPDNGSVAQAALLARVADDWSDNQLYVGLDATGFVDVWTLTGGTWNEVMAVQTTYSASADRRLEARVVGTSLDVYVDGSQVMSGVAVPAAPAGATQAGLFVDTSDPSSSDWAHFDDFEVDRWP